MRNGVGEALIKEYVCPGCVNGADTDCGVAKITKSYGWQCKSHATGTSMGPPMVKFALGLPKGFDRPPPDTNRERQTSKMLIRCWEPGEQPDWDRCNIPVWAMKQDGVVYVRTAMPRIADWATDVLPEGEFPDGAIDVAEFFEEID